VISGTAIANSPVCAGQNVTLTAYASNSTGLTYTWTGPNSYSITGQSAILAPASPTMNGVYSVTLDNGNCPAVRTVTVNVIPYPNFFLTTPTPTICQGGTVTATSVSQTPINQGQYYFQWQPSPGFGVWNPLQPSSPIVPPLLPVTQTLGTMVYSLTITPIILPCSTTRTLAITINNPLVPTFTPAPLLCNTSPQTQLLATPGGGTWTGNTSVGPTGIVSPAFSSIGSNTVLYSVSIGNCKVGNSTSFRVSKFHTAALTSTLNLVCVQDPSYNLKNLVQDTTGGKWYGTNVTSYKNFSPGGLPSGSYSFTYITKSLPDTGVCDHSTVLAVQVFNPPTPTINPIAGKCTNESTVTLTASPPGGSWSNNSAVSISGIQTPSLGTAGTNTVVYTAGQGTCGASASATFHISQFRTAALSGTVPHLCFNSNGVNLLSIAQNTTGTWTGINIGTNNVFSPTGLPTGVYMLTYNTTSWPEPMRCPDSRTIAVSVTNPVVPSLSNVGPLCSTDAAVQLSAMPSTGQWIQSSFLTLSGAFVPSLAAIGNNAVTYVIGTPTCNAKQTIQISVEAFVPALITSSLDALCNNNLPVSLSHLTQSGNGSWSGPGIQGKSFNPAKAGTGEFTLLHQTSSSPSGLCPDSDQLTVTVFSLAPPFVATAGPYCDNMAPIQLTVSPVGGIFRGENTDALTPSGVFSPPGAQTGANIVSYSITSGPCVAHTQATIDIVKFVSAELVHSPEVAYCRNRTAFNLKSLVRHPDGVWSGPGVSGGNMFDPSKANIGSNRLVYETFSTPLPTLCPDSRTVSINVEDIPNVSVVSHTYSACPPAEIVFNISTTNDPSAKGVWYFGDGSDPVEGLKTGHTFTAVGSYSVSFTYEKGACRAAATLPLPISIKRTPVADFEFSKPEVTIADPSVTLINRTSNIGDNRYLWTIGPIGRSDVNPAVSFTSAGTYPVKLRATSQEGCSHEVTKYIEVKNAIGVHVPNSFTPNYDGLNDVFKPVFSPYGLDRNGYSLEVFDRWGQVVFRTNDPDKGWDGTVGESVMKQDVYTYLLRYRDLDGFSHNFTGYVSLLTP
jgi:gliding motility-associated-like protein